MSEEKKLVESLVPALLVPTSSRYRVIQFADIVCCRADKSYSMVCLVDKEEVMISYGLARLTTVLPEVHFFRCHHSHLINRNKVQGIIREGSAYFLLLQGYRIPVSRSQQQAIKKLFYQL